MRSKFKWIFTLLVAFTMQFSFAQEKTVTGVVSDELGPIAGANIVVKGTTNGTTTDFDGNFSISAKQGDVLMVSYLGKKTSEVAVGSSSVVNVTLQEDILTGGEVVVTGAMGIKRKADQVTNSYSLVKSDEITQAGSPNVVQGLVGKVSGLQINTTSNGVNSSTRLVINGSRSITGNNQALVVIDNVISSLSVLQSLPPETIETINVIKGAQGAALYGAGGVNGVLIVTTIKGEKDGKLAVTFKSTMDFQQVAYLPERQTRYGQGWFGEHVAVENGGWGAQMDGSLQPVGLAQADGSYIMSPYAPIEDNIKDFFQTGTTYQNSVTISGGSLKDGYALMSVGRQDREFVVKDDTYKRTNILFKAGRKFNKWTVEGNVQYNSTKQKNTSTRLYSELLQTATNIPVGAFANAGNNHHWNVYYRNPYWTRENVRFESNTDYVSIIPSLGYEVNKNISVTWTGNAQISSGYSTSHDNGFAEEDDLLNDYFSRAYVGSFFDSTSKGTSYYSDLMVNFDYMLTDNISFKANLGNNIQQYYNRINQVGGTNLDVDGFYNYINILEPSLASGLSNSYSLRREVAFFLNADFGYKDYLTLNLTGRQEISSRLPEENNSYFYPSASIAFIPTKAFEGIRGNVLNYAKIYGGFTATGNASNIGVYQIDEIGSSASGYPYGDLNSYVVNTTPTDKNIKPEYVKTIDLGLSLGFFNDRLTLDAQYYAATTTNLITANSVSSASGLQRVVSNIGELENKGYNFDLGFTPIKMKDNGFRWDGRLNFSHSKAIVKKVSDDTDEVSLGNGSSLVGVFATVGEEFPSIKGTGYVRNPQGQVVVDADSGNPLKTAEFIKLGKATPDYIIGYTNSFSYKGIRLTAVMDYRTGHQFYSDTKRQMAWSGHLIESAENGRNGGFIFPNSVINTGTEANPVYVQNTSVLTGGSTYASYQTYFSDEFAETGENLVMDATAFKVRELSLAYTLPTKMIERTGLSELTLGVNARNPFMVLPKENRNYADPESSNTTGNAQGLSTTGQYPLTRTYGFSLNARF